jgi:hypothetical protein
MIPIRIPGDLSSFIVRAPARSQKEKAAILPEIGPAQNEVTQENTKSRDRRYLT